MAASGIFIGTSGLTCWNRWPAIAVFETPRASRCHSPIKVKLRRRAYVEVSTAWLRVRQCDGVTPLQRRNARANALVSAYSSRSAT